MLFLPKATRARNSKSRYRLLYDTEKEKTLNWSIFQFFTHEASHGNLLPTDLCLLKPSSGPRSWMIWLMGW